MVNGHEEPKTHEELRMNIVRVHGKVTVFSMVPLRRGISGSSPPLPSHPQAVYCIQYAGKHWKATLECTATWGPP